MSRVFVHAEWRIEVDLDVSHTEQDREWDALLAPLYERAVALGGRVVGWGRRSIVVDFSWDDLYDAVDFLVDAPVAPQLAAGLCHGEAQVLCDGTRLALVVGEVLGQAAGLAQLARPGEILISQELATAAADTLKTAGEVGHRTGRPSLRAFFIDPEDPFLDNPSPNSQRENFELVPSGRMLGAPSSRAPESVRARQVERLVSVTEALGDAVPAVFPAEVTAALRKSDTHSLRELARSVRDNQAYESAERLEAIAELAGGRSGEALRKLRQSKERAQRRDPSTRCRASLALAVALSAAGRPYEAAIESLEGVARAREGSDSRGELACCRFLSQLALSMGDEVSAGAWARLVG